jgi:Winged helix DNA-binding domain
VRVRGGEGPLDGVVRMWAMRGTLHLVAADDVPLMLAVFADLHLRRGERRLTELGLPPDAAGRAADAVAEFVAAGPRTRTEIASRLGLEGQAPIHVIRRAALAGRVIEVGDRYGPFDPGPLPDRADALRELARRYGAAHAPAAAEDFAAWSGLPAADVRAAWSSDPEVGDEPARGPIALLPAFDEWLFGWASRDFTLPPGHAAKALRGGIIRAVAIDDGRIFATWRRKGKAIVAEPFERLTKAQASFFSAQNEA